jgi:glutamyl-tRNA synthetase
MLNNYIEILQTNKATLCKVDDIENITKPFIEQNELKFPQLFQPIRIALTGGTQAPSVYDIIYVLGIDESISRLNTAISKNFDKEDV